MVAASRPSDSDGMSDAPRSQLSRVAFHALGVVLLGAAVVAAGIAFVLLSFGTSTCNEPDPDALRGLRLGTFAIGMALAAVPAGWAWLARYRRQGWQPWAVTGAVIAAVGIVQASSIDELGTFCF
jgi:uncharacterized BrkB/YihY/UPF0761 family membrane protein